MCAMRNAGVNDNDAVCGIAAGGTTPYVLGALQEARRRGAATIFLTCVAPFTGQPPADVAIHALTGPEVLTGSTRLKAGTATKLILNQLTTTAFVRMGKCYENLMVDLRCTNDKLWDRGARIVANRVRRTQRRRTRRATRRRRAREKGHRHAPAQLRRRHGRRPAASAPRAAARHAGVERTLIRSRGF